jgi:lipopolysaccharide transport system permease protein
MTQISNWTTVITPKNNWFRLNLKEIWEYRDLIWIFVRRDIVAIYKQTVLGPVWFMLGPLFTVFTYTFLFKEVAHLSTDGLPGPLFYLGGTTLWNYFNSCFNGASSTFSSNAGIFGKVYFPRLVSPISMVLSNLLKLSIQLFTYLCFFIYYLVQPDSVIEPNLCILLIPIIIIVLGGIAMGFGIIVSSFTTKYRDLNMLIGVFMTLLMYATPIMYPVSDIPPMYKTFLNLNPISPMIEAFRYAFTGRGYFTVASFGYSVVFMLIILTLGIFVFNKTEKTFMDTV